MNEQVYIIPSNIFIIEGYKRSLLIDTQFETTMHVAKNIGVQLNSIKFSYLSEKEYQTLNIELKKLFISVPYRLIRHLNDIEMNVHSNYLVETIIIQVSTKTIKFFKKIILKIIELRCRNILIDFTMLTEISDSFINEINYCFDSSFITSIQLNLTYKQYLVIRKRFSKQVEYRLSKFVIYETNLDTKIEGDRLMISDMKIYEFSNKVYQNNGLRSIINAHTNNLYYNKLLIIDKDNRLKFSFFYDRGISIIESSRKKIYNYILDNSNNIWNISKDQISICNDCEYRYSCMDRILPLQREDNSWYRSVECNYNPYICKWEGEEGYLNLAACGVRCDIAGFEIDHEKIATINQELWGEDE